MKTKAPNIRAVAAAAGVSGSTVSMVLNNSPVPSAKTRAKVLKVAKELNYQPDPLFRQAFHRRRTGQGAKHIMTQTIGFLTAEAILTRANKGDNYYSCVLEGIQQAAESGNYHLMIKTIRAHELALPALVSEGRVDGLVIEGEISNDIREMLTKRLPVSFIEHSGQSLMADSVMPNIEQAVHEKLTYLWDLGHRNIVTFQQAAPSIHAKLYLRAFHEFFAERNQAVTHPALCKQRGINAETHASVLEEYAQELAAASPRPTALVTWDVYACSLLENLKGLGLRIPKDMSVIGLDDSPEASATNPQLTSYRFPMEELGRSATKLLIDRIEDRSRPAHHILINGKLMERTSCARP